MAQFELPIYGEDNELVKTYETNIAKWGLLLEAHEAQENLENKSTGEQIEIIHKLLMKLFPGLTLAELKNADVGDVFNTFAQIVKKAENIHGSGGGNNSKN